MVAESKDSGEEAQSQEDRQNNTAGLEEDFLKLLNDEQARLYQEVVVPYLRSPREDEDAFDLSIAQRWIFQKVIELGWTPELFGEFDSRVNPRMRNAHKAERIGKKYQWIALHEFLARVSDNFCFSGNRWSNEPQIYRGPWQIGRRDIDPSCLIRLENQDRDLAQQAWWCPVDHANWEAETDNVSWLKKDIDLPSVESLIQVTDPHSNNKWLTLNGSYEWQEPTPIGEDTYEAPRRRVWYIINSYIVKKSYSEDFFGWLKEQDFMGRWMPEPSDFYHVYIGEYPWASTFRTEYSSGWTKDWRGSKIPYPVVVPCARYMWESGFDCSNDETVSMNLPSSWLVHELGISGAREKSKFVSSNGDMIAFDPSVDNTGPSALLISELALMEFLRENDYEVFWTVLGEKGFIGGSFSGTEQKSRLELSGACRLESGNVRCSITNRFSS